MDLTCEEIMRRNEEIISCQEQINLLRQTVQKHKRELKEHHINTALRRIGPQAWFNLTPKEQRCKSYVMIMLEHEVLPFGLDVGNFSRSLPPHLRNDRDVLLARLRRPNVAQELAGLAFELPASAMGDIEIVKAAVKAYPMVLESLEEHPLAEHIWENEDVFKALIHADSFNRRSTLLRLFSVSLRGKLDLMLKAVEHGMRVFDVIPKHLRNSKPFALKAAELMTNASSKYSYGTKLLKPFSHRLKADPTVVEAFCRCDGYSLAFAAYPLRRNEKIVRIACEQEPAALSYCLKGGVRTRIVNDKEFWMKCLQKWKPTFDLFFFTVEERAEFQNSLKHWEKLWSALGSTLMQDPEIALLMLEKAPSDLLCVEHFPESVFTSKDFLVKAAGLGKLNCLPTADFVGIDCITIDSDFCCSLLVQEYLETDVVNCLIKHTPTFFSDRRFWEVCNPSQYDEVLRRFFDEISEIIINDKEIMLRFAENEASARHLAGRLWQTTLLTEKEILDKLLSTDPSILADLPDFIQLQYPDLVVKCIQSTSIHDDFHVDLLQDSIHEALWANRDVALAWIRLGGQDLFFLDEYFPYDEEILLAVAEHNWDEFFMNSDTMLDNWEFVVGAVAVNGRVWTLLERYMKEDFEISLTAFSNFDNLPYHCSSEDFPYLTAFARKIRTEIDFHDTFVKLILCSIDLDESSLLATLNQGRDTCYQYKKTIADYIGLPRNDKLRKLRKASENLRVWGF